MYPLLGRSERNFMHRGEFQIPIHRRELIYLRRRDVDGIRAFYFTQPISIVCITRYLDSYDHEYVIYG